MHAFTTYRFQLIDVAVGKPFKDELYEQWATWMLEENNRLGLTPAANLRHPSRKNALNWIKKSWDLLKPSCILNAVDKCYMNPDPGPVIEGYQEDYFAQGIKENEDELQESDISQ